MTLDTLPQWSDWHSRDLGFADSPQLIVCRICHRPKRAHGSAFRKDTRSGTGFSMVCRPCETATPQLRTLDAQLKRLTNDPSLSPADRHQQILALPDKVRASKTERLTKAHREIFDLAFKVQWTSVRKIVAYRHARLSMRVGVARYRGASKGGQPTGLAKAMDDYPQINNYVQFVKTCYSNIVTRLRDLEGWHKAIGNHNPPSYWEEHTKPLYDAFEAERFKGRQASAAQLPLNHLYGFAVAELLTKSERDNMSRMAEELKGCLEWQNLVLNDRVNGTLQYLLLPWLRRPYDDNPNDPLPPYSDFSPAWLRAWNEKEDKP